MNLSTSIFSFKRAAKILLWLLVFLFLFDRGLGYLIYSIEDRFYPESDFANRFREYMKGRSYSTLILGTSRTYEGIHPYYFKTILGQEAYREAYIGRGPEYYYSFYDFYKTCAGVPKIVIYGTDYFIFSVDSERRWLSRFGKGMEIPAPFSTFSLLLRDKNGNENLLNDALFRLEAGLSRDKGSPSRPEVVQDQDFVGSDPRPGEVEQVKPEEYKRVGYSRFPGKEGTYLKMLLDTWAKDGVTVLFVILPDYYGTYQTNVGRMKALADLKRLTRNYPNAHIYDFNRPRVFPLTKVEYFRNGGWGLANSHLSREGAEVFDRLLLEKIRKWYSR